jgi:O-antigen/teichoic acid export membrane protein
VGILQAVVQSERGDDPVFLNTAFTMQAIRGVVLWTVAALLAWPMSLLFKEPSLTWIIPAGALGSLLYGLTSMRICALRRHLRPFPIAILEITSQVGGLVATVISAKFFHMGVAALVVGTLTNSVLHTGGSHLIRYPHKDRFGMEPRARQEILTFGRWIFLSSIVTFAAGRGDACSARPTSASTTSR